MPSVRWPCESWGYKTDIVEFVATEHTPRNLMIRAVRTREAASGGDVHRRVSRDEAILGRDALH